MTLSLHVDATKAALSTLVSLGMLTSIAMTAKWASALLICLDLEVHPAKH